MELYSNNAVGTLAAGISDSDTEIDLVDEPWAYNFPYNESASDFQRATITDTDPEVFEIVYITMCPGLLGMVILRGQEETTARAWPAGSKISARVTAGMLRQYLSADESGEVRTNPPYAPAGTLVVNARARANTAHVVIGGYPFLPLMTAQPTASAGSSITADMNMGREAVGGSLMVDLGDAVPVWTSGLLYNDGAMVAPPIPDGFNYMFQAASGTETSQTTTEPGFSGDVYSVNALNGAAVVGLWVPIPEPLVINLVFNSDYGLVLSEVGFICMDHTASTTPTLSVGTPSAPTRFASAVSLTDATADGTIHRIPVNAGGEMVQTLRFTLDTAATGRMLGRFYWRGFFVQLDSP